MGNEALQLCPCGSQQQFSNCCGVSRQTTEMLRFAIHEVGHLLALPAEAKAHVSLKHPCTLCRGDEGNQKSDAHSGYDPDYSLPIAVDIVYSLAGGASEVACGMPITMVQKEFGEFPDGMENDFKDLRKRCDLEDKKIWPLLTPSLADCFSEIVRHFMGVTKHIGELSRRLRAQKELDSKELDLSFFARDVMQSKIESILGL